MIIRGFDYKIKRVIGSFSLLFWTMVLLEVVLRAEVMRVAAMFWLYVRI